MCVCACNNVHESRNLNIVSLMRLIWIRIGTWLQCTECASMFRTNLINFIVRIYSDVRCAIFIRDHGILYQTKFPVSCQYYGAAFLRPSTIRLKSNIANKKHWNCSNRKYTKYVNDKKGLYSKISSIVRGYCEPKVWRKSHIKPYNSIENQKSRTK